MALQSKTRYCKLCSERLIRNSKLVWRAKQVLCSSLLVYSEESERVEHDDEGVAFVDHGRY